MGRPELGPGVLLCQPGGAPLAVLSRRATPGRGPGPGTAAPPDPPALRARAGKLRSAAQGADVDAKDAKGVSCLGYAIGASPRCIAFSMHSMGLSSHFQCLAEL